MFEILIEVESAAVPCPSVPPMKPGLGFVVRDEKLFPRDAAPICIFALQSMMPFFTAKQRAIAADDWMICVHHSQCPHPEHRVVWRLEQRPIGTTEWLGADVQWQSQDIGVVVEDIRGVCTSGTAIGDGAIVRNGLLHLPNRCACGRLRWLCRHWEHARCPAALSRRVGAVGVPPASWSARIPWDR